MHQSAVGPRHAFQRYRIAPDVHGPFDDSDGIRNKFDYVELRNGA
jgi:hypothetical protein